MRGSCAAHTLPTHTVWQAVLLIQAVYRGKRARRAGWRRQAREELRADETLRGVRIRLGRRQADSGLRLLNERRLMLEAREVVVRGGGGEAGGTSVRARRPGGACTVPQVVHCPLRESLLLVNHNSLHV